MIYTIRTRGVDYLHSDLAFQWHRLGYPDLAVGHALRIYL